jgi:hypothetical protein
VVARLVAAERSVILVQYIGVALEDRNLAGNFLLIYENETTNMKARSQEYI